MKLKKDIVFKAGTELSYDNPRGHIAAHVALLALNRDATAEVIIHADDPGMEEWVTP